MIACSACGSEDLPEGSNFCENCGAPLRSGVPAPEEPPRAAADAVDATPARGRARSRTPSPAPSAPPLRFQNELEAEMLVLEDPINFKKRKTIETKVDTEKDGPEPKKQKATVDDGEEDLFQLYTTLTQEEILNIWKLQGRATLEAKFCDERGNDREFFRPTEDVFIKLTFANPTDKDLYVMLYRGIFARSGVHVTLEGQDRRYSPSSGSQFVVAKIPPGQTHTFTPRQFCRGVPANMGRQKDSEWPINPNRVDSRNFAAVPFWTPAKAGTYHAQITDWKGKFPLVIRHGDGMQPEE